MYGYNYCLMGFYVNGEFNMILQIQKVINLDL